MSRKSQFGLAGLLKYFLLISAIMAAMFVPTDQALLIALLLSIGTIIWICLSSRVRPAGCGAAVGFAFPAILALRSIGAIFWSPEQGGYREVGDSFLVAAATVVFLGSLGILLGAAVGTIVAMVNDWSEVED